MTFFKRRYSKEFLRIILTEFKDEPYKVILDLKLQGNHKSLIQRLQSKL